MKKQLIVNADDFGLCESVNRGILAAYQNGIVRSTTLMANMHAFEHAAALARETPGLGVGVHLTLTAGGSVGGPYRTLTQPDGSFYAQTELFERLDKLDWSEVEQEFTAQIEKIRAAGVSITHIDSHHHVHTRPGIFDVFKELALRYGFGARVYSRAELTGKYSAIKTPATFDDGFYGDGATADSLLERVARAAAPLELMAHPGYAGEALSRLSRYSVQREHELAVLTDERLMAQLNEMDVDLCSYAAL